MKDIFLSYASDDRQRARRLVEAFETSGYTVWWDRRLAIGKNYEEEIQRRLEASRCVVVLWSQTSVKSRWVKAEAQDAAEQERLFPVFLDRVKAPLEYRYLNGVDLSEWDGSPRDSEFGRLIESLPSEAGSTAATTDVSLAVPAAGSEAHATGSPTAAAPENPATDRADGDVPGREPGEVTAMRLVANELAEIVDRIARKHRGSRKGPPSPDRKPGEVTVAQAISRRLAQALTSFADPRGRVLPSTLALRYLGWSLVVPTTLLVAMHLLVYLLRPGP